MAQVTNQALASERRAASRFEKAEAELEKHKVARVGFLQKLAECSVREARVRTKAQKLVAELATALARADAAEAVLGERRTRAKAEQLVSELEEALVREGT